LTSVIQKLVQGKGTRYEELVIGRSIITRVDAVSSEFGCELGVLKNTSIAAAPFSAIYYHKVRDLFLTTFRVAVISRPKLQAYGWHFALLPAL
jgi:hypothetical protein